MKARSFIAHHLWRYLLLALLFLGAAWYHMRAVEFRFPYWFHLQKNDEPFFLAEPGLANPAQPDVATFLRPRTIQAGLKDRDIVLSVNGRQLTGTRVYGEEVAASRPGDSMLVRVLRRQQNARPQGDEFFRASEYIYLARLANGDLLWRADGSSGGFRSSS